MLFYNLVGCSALHVPCEGLALLVVENLAEHHTAWVLVVKVCGYAHAAIAYRIEWQHCDIEVDEVWIIAVDGIEGAVVEVCHKLA